MTPTVLIVGGGLAGLSAAAALAPRGFAVTVLEARNRLGGRAGSFTDAATGQILDVCQHVSMGCCTNFAHFCRTLGIAHLLKPQPALWFMTPDRRLSRFAASFLPAPAHLAPSFLRAHYLSVGEKLRIAWGLACLQRANANDDVPFLGWLERHRQTPRTIDRFWGLVLVSALNESADRVGLRYARKVFVDGFLGHRRGFQVELPTVPLGALYGEAMQKWFADHGAQIQMQRAVRSVRVAEDRVESLTPRAGDPLRAAWYILATPFDRLLDLLPPEWIARETSLSGLRNLETSPITSVHLWYSRPILSLPHVVLVDCIGQWVFNRSESAAGEHYVQVVVSAARPFRGLGTEEIQRRVSAEMAALFPQADGALVRSRVVTEQAATFSAVPGVDRWRPPQQTALANLFLAGDWTATGWPATMEGAVRSGYLAAEALLQRAGRPETLVQPELAGS